MRFSDLPRHVQIVLLAVCPGDVLRIPKPLDLGHRIRTQHDANMGVYGMTEAESIREIAHRLHLTHAQVRKHL